MVKVSQSSPFLIKCVCFQLYLQRLCSSLFYWHFMQFCGSVWFPHLNGKLHTSSSLDPQTNSRQCSLTNHCVTLELCICVTHRSHINSLMCHFCNGSMFLVCEKACSVCFSERRAIGEWGCSRGLLCNPWEKCAVGHLVWILKPVCTSRLYFLLVALE